MSGRPQKRTLRIFLDAHNLKDAASILKALAASQTGADVDVHIGKSGPVEPPPTPQAKSSQIEQLETAGRDAAAKKLDGKRRRIAAKAPKTADGKPSKPKRDPKAVVEARRSWGATLNALAKNSLVVTVKTVVRAAAAYVAEEIRGTKS